MDAVNRNIERNQKATLGIFGFLILGRFVGSYFPLTAWGGNSFVHVYMTISFLGLTLILWLNKQSIGNLNIDGHFIRIFILTGVLLFLYFWISWIGVIVSACAILVLKWHWTKKLKYSENGSFAQIMFFTVLGLLPVLLIRLPARGLSEHINAFLKLRLEWLLWIIIGGLWAVVYEEMLFRGVLWMILRGRGYSETKILFVQAALFWFAHHNLISRSSFWVILPLFSLWLGFLVLRSKSLTPSVWVHFIYNLSLKLFQGM